ncbi:MAG: hypothetical protein CVV24_11435 [Ignavibacteriae bacterium HGW-Ignavibacteriae-3]|nr:MAG: hypothetical protein CVV24_11435 [Ignavibacteriae bacterium HGW-Ignavibacteriae-3]
MICPKCECEYVEGIQNCPDCDTELIPVEQFEGKLLHPSDWVIVYSSADVIETEMLKANLLGAAIESIILSQRDRSIPYLGEVSPIKLMVKKRDAESAMQIINDINDSPGEDVE